MRFTVYYTIFGYLSQFAKTLKNDSKIVSDFTLN